MIFIKGKKIAGGDGNVRLYEYADLKQDSASRMPDGRYSNVVRLVASNHAYHFKTAEGARSYFESLLPRSSPVKALRK